MWHKNIGGGGGKSSRRSSDYLVSPRSVLDRCTSTTTSENSCTAETPTTAGAVAAYTEPSTPASPQGEEPPAQWKGAMEAWRARTKRRLASGMSFGIRGGGSGSGTAPFMRKTFEMMDDPSTDVVVSWSNESLC